jgi:P27 family predicted phage terminase small subunit
MKGRKPTATALKLVKGNPGKRPINQDEPQFDVVIPKCPMKLDKVGKAEWDKLSKLLFDAGVLTEVDDRTLAVYCHIWSQIVLLTAEIEKYGYLSYSEKSTDVGSAMYEAKANPAAVRLEKLYAEHRAYSAILGLDPANRGKIKVNKKPEPKKDGKERFFK